MCRCATEKKNPKKVIFLASGDFFYLGHKTLNVFKQLNINSLPEYTYNITRIFKRTRFL